MNIQAHEMLLLVSKESKTLLIIYNTLGMLKPKLRNENTLKSMASFPCDVVIVVVVRNMWQKAHIRVGIPITNINLIPVLMNNYNHYQMWDEKNLSIPRLQQLSCWSLQMDKWFHVMIYWAFDYLSRVGFNLMHINKRTPRWILAAQKRSRSIPRIPISSCGKKDEL